MNRTRTLLILGVTVLAFTAAFTAGRALRPAGAPAAVAPVPGTQPIAMASAGIVSVRLGDGELPPLVRDPRPDRPDSREGSQATSPPTERSQPGQPVQPQPEPPGEAAPGPAAPPPAQPEPAKPPPEPEGDAGGDWSSGN